MSCRYPDRLWHKPSYNSYIDWPLRGVDIFANWTAQQTTGKFKQFTYLQASKLEMEGESTLQPLPLLDSFLAS